MDYAPGRSVMDARAQLTTTFSYENAISGLLKYYDNLPVTERNTMLNSNLDAGFPVMLQIWRFDQDGLVAGGHSIVSDGYGYDNQTMYHHLNMGWSNRDNDMWYNLPDIDSSIYHYTVFDLCLYNIYPTGSGEIISGRVTDSNGIPLENVIVTATPDEGGTYYHSEPTGENGIYALAKIPSDSSYSISASLDGYFFNTYDTANGNKVNTGTSTNRSTTVGNVWGVDFSGIAPVRPVVTTQAVTDINNTMAMGHGTIVEPGNIEWMQHGVCWGRTPNMTYPTIEACSYEGTDRQAGSFDTAITLLLPGTTYYVQAYVFHRLGGCPRIGISFKTEEFSKNKRSHMCDIASIIF